MSHFAKVVDGLVTEVIAADQDFIEQLPDRDSWIQTSYRTWGNKHYGADGEPDGGVALRGNFAGVGYTYDKANDVFYPPKPYPTAALDKTTWTWGGIDTTHIA